MAEEWQTPGLIQRLLVAMADLHDSRVLIASLFLPQGTVYYDDDPHGHAASDPPPAVIPPPLTNARPTHQLSPSKSLLPAAAFSIVDDLTKQSTPMASPVEDKSNPFSAFTSPRLGPQAGVRPLPSRLPTLNAVPGSIIPAKSAVPVATPPVKFDSLSTQPSQRARRPSRTASRSSSLRRSTSVVRATPRLGFLDAPHYTPWQIEASSHGNTGLFNAVNSVPDIIRKKLWVGIIDSPTDDFSDDLKVDLELKYQAEHDSLPVWISDSEFNGCYDVYCHQVLWPTLHYTVPDAPKTRANLYDSKSFEQYSAVSRKFAEAIISVYQEGDIIMVNDYHLMLLPELIREKIPSATIGFFLHVTFPSSEVFRCLAARQQLLRGMLGADLIAFQTHNHMRHFRQTVHRILGLEAMPKGIQLENSFVDVQSVPMGIDLASLYQKRRDPEVQEWVTNLEQRYAGVKLIVGRDKLDEVQGVRQKILAFERLLEQYPEFRGNAVLIQVALSTTSENESLASDSLTSIIARINSRFSSLSYTPVVLLHTSELNFSQYLALLTVADAFIVTSLREGMALRTHEFIECQEGRKRPLILSEFTGSYSFSGFRSCFVVNPYDTRNTAEAIRAALTISDDEAAARWKELHRHVVSQTAQAFVTSFLTRTKRAHAEHTQRPYSSIPEFHSSTILPLYQNAQKRLILLGLENTLTFQDPKVTRDKGFFLPAEVQNLLRSLTEDRRNVVYVLSGLPMDGALDNAADVLPNVGFIAENGCYIKPKIKDGPTGEWINLVEGISMQWKKSCMEILSYFTERTPGSFIEERRASIRWRYWPGNPDDSELPWARRQAAEAQNHIWDSLGEKFGLRIVPATRSFLVIPATASRLNAAELVIQGKSDQNMNLSEPFRPGPAPGDTSPNYDFILAIGSDERLLARLNAISTSHTVSTGLKSSDAKWRIDRSAVLQELSALHSTSQDERQPL